MQLRFWLVIALAVGLGCSGGGSSPGDGGANDRAAADQAGGDTAAGCSATLAQATFCEATFAGQVTANPCDDPTNPNTTRMCGNGTYKLWETLFVGSQTCVYNAAGTTLVGARTCGSTIDCPNNCLVYGIAESAYVQSTCGTDSPACP